MIGPWVVLGSTAMLLLNALVSQAEGQRTNRQARRFFMLWAVVGAVLTAAGI